MAAAPVSDLSRLPFETVWDAYCAGMISVEQLLALRAASPLFSAWLVRKVRATRAAVEAARAKE